MSLMFFCLFIPASSFKKSGEAGFAKLFDEFVSLLFELIPRAIKTIRLIR